MRALAVELELDAPLVAENGATIAIPERSALLEPSDEGPVDDGFVISTQGASERRFFGSRMTYARPKATRFLVSQIGMPKQWRQDGLSLRAQHLPSIDTVPSRLSGKTVLSVGRPFGHLD